MGYRLKQLSLQRDRTKLICHHVPIFLSLRSNNNFNIKGDKSARHPNNPEEEHLSFGQMVKLCRYYTTKYDTKVGIHVGKTIDFEFNNDSATIKTRSCFKKTESFKN